MSKVSSASNNPLVSIIMPVFNCEKYVSLAIASVLKQTYSNWELIAIDDCSTDASYKMLKDFAKKDSRIKVSKTENNVGSGVVRDMAIAEASGDLIACMDADDISYPDRLEKQVTFLLTNSDVVALGGQVRLIDQDGKLIGAKTFPTKNQEMYDMLYFAIPIQQPTLMVNRTLLPSNFTWYDGLRTAQDLYLFYKIVNYGKLANLDDFVLDYRYTAQGNSLKDPKKTFAITKSIRKMAVEKFNYVPTLKGRVMNNFQSLVVAILPNKSIPYIYKVVRNVAIFAKLPLIEKFMALKSFALSLLLRQRVLVAK